MEIREDRYGRKASLVTSQLSMASWHQTIGASAYADAILDRLLHSAHRVEPEGESLRRTKAPINAAYVPAGGHTFIDRTLYLAKSWMIDPARLATTHFSLSSKLRHQTGFGRSNDPGGAGGRRSFLVGRGGRRVWGQ